jgi:thioredoxin-related protein
MKHLYHHRGVRFLARGLVAAVMLAAIAAIPQRSEAAELVMFEQAGCPWCQVFDREIAPIYPKTDEGHLAPLRRVRIDRPTPPDLKFIQVERLTPLFVLVDQGHEIGRIRGYPGEDNFWGLLDVLVKKLDRPRTDAEQKPVLKISLRAAD